MNIRFVLLFFSVSALMNQSVNAALTVESKNLVVDSANNAVNVTFGPFVSPFFTFNYFPNGAFSITGKLSSEFNSTLATKSVGGVNYTPVKIYNNKTFDKLTVWQKQPIFFHNPVLGFTSDFLGKGNQYIGAKAILSNSDILYFWMLVNLDAGGKKLTILKLGFEDVPGNPALTGNEGENAAGISELFLPDLNIFPQPAKNILTLDLGSDVQVAYHIYNLNGQLVQKGDAFIRKEIVVSEMEKGIYLLVLTNDHALLIRKIIIE
ncbi:MAG: T9SS type A sorting domain-containing protein [Bacteroidota bacterium]|nr:T9SS type A sorting domain-containing protein [Bacteroidota bacterium]